MVDVDGESWHQLVITGQYTYYGGKHRKATPKSPSGVRRVPIGPELVDVLKAHMARVDKTVKNVRDAGLPWKDHGLMFPGYRGGPIEPSHLYRARDQIIKAVNAERPKYLISITLHELRSVYITYITREPVRQGQYSPKLVMYLAGHSHPSVALEHYNRVIEEDLASATFEPLMAAISGKPRGKSSKVKDAESVETAS